MKQKQVPGRSRSTTSNATQKITVSGGGLSSGKNVRAYRQASPSTNSKTTHEDVPGEGGLDEPTKEGQTHSRGGGGARGSNH